jgi:hypothetical protein
MSVPYFIVTKLNNTVVDGLVENKDIAISVDFTNTVQGNIETDTFTFVNDAYTIIKNYIADGQNGGVGLLEGIPFSIDIQEGNTSTNIFDGFLDPESFEEIEFEAKIKMKIVEKDGVTSLSERLQGLSFGLLDSVGAITSSDWNQVDYVVEKEVNFLEIALISLSIYIMIKEIIEASYRLAKQIATILTIASSSLTGSVGALIYAIASLIFTATYIALMLKALIDLVTELKEKIYPKTRQYFCLQYQKGLQKIFKYLGYEFYSPISELSEYYYLPSKAEGRQNKGIPFDVDYGFLASEFVDIALKMFNAQIFVINNRVEIRTESDQFFINQSNYIFPDVLEKTYKYNTNELKESVLISFKEDISDEYTVSNWKGTSYVVTTRPKVVNNAKNVNIKGFNEVRFPVALGTRKEKLTDLEEALKVLFKVADKLSKILGGSGKSFDSITERTGLLKLSNRYFNIPKVIKLDGKRLPTNYRNNLSSKYLYDNYLIYNSFVANNFRKQRQIFEGIRIPFSYNDYKNVVQNSYFTTADGKRGKFTDVNWIIDSDTAEVSYWIEEIYTRNLKEEFYEVE